MRENVKTVTMLDDVTTTATGSAIKFPLGTRKTFHATGETSAGAGAATIGIEVSSDGTNYVEVDELSLTLGTTTTSDYYETEAAWLYMRGKVKTISGTDATVRLIAGF